MITRADIIEAAEGMKPGNPVTEKQMEVLRALKINLQDDRFHNVPGKFPVDLVREEVENRLIAWEE